MTRRSSATRASRWCSLCGLRAYNRRLFKTGANGRYVCVDERACAARKATAEA